MNLSRALSLLLLVACNELPHTLAQAQVRFEKFNFTTVQALSIDFPLNETAAAYLRDNSNSTSVVLQNEECDDTIDLEAVKSSLSENGLFPPTHPENVDFWNEFAGVVNVQAHLKTKQDNPCMTDPLPLVMPAVTELWKGFGILDVAEAVYDEFPGIYHNQMIANWLGDANQKLSFNSDVIPRFGKRDFLRGPVMLSEMIGRAIRVVGPCDFSLKWIVGRARPEEIAWKLNKGIIDVPDGVDEKILNEMKASIERMKLKDPTDFTAYAEGSPTHPSWPAMHSASSAASFWLDVVMDLTDDQLCEARMLDWSVSYARTVAGVHYPTDNIAGLIVGQEILAQRLPTILKDEYGSDVDIVKSRVLEKNTFDWNTFEESDCYQKHEHITVPAAKPLFCFDRREIPIRPVPTPPNIGKGGKAKSAKKGKKGFFGKFKRSEGKSTKSAKSTNRHSEL